MSRWFRTGGSSPVSTVPRPSQRKLVPRRAGDGGPNQTIDRIRCTVCGFAGNPITVQPGGNFPTTFTTTGSTYVWAQADEALSTLDQATLPVPQPGVACAFCGATMLLGGSRGKGQ